nr:Holliday junction branch migration protein RuvA [Parvularcula dongshanensis]
MSGRVLTVGEDTAIVEAGGVGYEVQGTPRLLMRLTPGEPASLSIETLVAETYIRLVAFESETERKCFRLLQSVQGVGAKAALSILQVLTPAALLDAIAVQDKSAVARAQGVGPKLAQRVVTELKGKTAGLGAGVPHGALADRLEGEEERAAPAGIKADAVTALLGLGFDEGSARQAVIDAGDAADSGLEALITAALKRLSR